MSKDCLMCPFCGAKLERVTTSHIEGEFKWWHHPLTGPTVDAIYYPKCVLDGYSFPDRPDFAEMWNRRKG